ncbi:MAG TPA: hypothetical protein VF078_08075 [Nitrospira sp.]
MSIHHTSRTGDRVGSHADAIVSLRRTDHRRELTDHRLRDPNSSQNMVALPWEDAE